MDWTGRGAPTGRARSVHGRTPVFAVSIQTRNRRLIIWYGEKSGSFWAASSSGLVEVPDAATLTRLLAPEPTGA